MPCAITHLGCQLEMKVGHKRGNAHIMHHPGQGLANALPRPSAKGRKRLEPPFAFA